MSQVWSRLVSVLIQRGPPNILLRNSQLKSNSKAKVIWKSFELDTNASQACWYYGSQYRVNGTIIILFIRLFQFSKTVQTKNVKLREKIIRNRHVSIKTYFHLHKKYICVYPHIFCNRSLELRNYLNSIFGDISVTSVKASRGCPLFSSWSLSSSSSAACPGSLSWCMTSSSSTPSGQNQQDEVF